MSVLHSSPHSALRVLSRRTQSLGPAPVPLGLVRTPSPHLSPDLPPRRGLNPGSPRLPQKLPKKKEEVA